MPPPLHCVGRVCVFSHAGLTWISCAGLRWTSCLVCTSAWSVCPGFMPCCVWSGCVVSHFFRKRGHAPACCGGLGCVCIDGLGRVVFGRVVFASLCLFARRAHVDIMRRAQVDIMPSLYKCVVGVSRVYAVLRLVWLRCVPFFSQAGSCPGMLRWVGMRLH